MKITKTSMFTGIKRSREIDVTTAQLQAWEQGELIQNAMPDLSDDDREFIMTGVAADEWDKAFGGEDE